MSNNQFIINELRNVFNDILDNNEISLSEDTFIKDIEGWDSLANVQLVVAMEKHFNISFNSKEIRNWVKISEVVLSIKNKLSDKEDKGVIDHTHSEPKQFLNPRNHSKNLNNSIPNYKRNFVSNFKHIKYGKNCFIAEGVSLTNVSLGDNVWINKFATVYSSHSHIRIGSNSYIGPYVWIEGHAGIEMGNYVHIGGPSTSIYTHSGIKIALNNEILGNPGFKPKDQKSNYFRVPIRIGNHVWIGPNCSISPGVIIQDYVVVLPNTYVKSGVIEPYSLVQGNGIIENNSDFVKSLINS